MIKMITSNEFDAERAIQKTTASASITSTVTTIIADIIKRGDSALREYTKKFDGCVIDNIELSRVKMEKAILDVDPEFIGVLERAAKNIEDFHRNQIQKGFEVPPKNGIIMGQKITPIERVGIYVPGGTAAYPSTVLMNCIPAKLAGVKEIIIATPPSDVGSSSETGNSGFLDGKILAAAKIAGASRVFIMGGAQAIAALAYGTESVPRVDKITGPGNAYVAEAKRQVFGVVG
ncbi:MAG: histidinol dehydrogenase, partial [Oscillospiraceae bacterium]|nr:histidinol dehydrogenase [Oscillospiraceae bacterium]